MTEPDLLVAVPPDLREAYAEGCIAIEAEGLFLDERRWADWLDLFSEDVRYWVPTWRGDGNLASDPELEMSHIFYSGRAALEDRVARFTSPDSPASNPPPRTTHLLSGFRLLSGSESHRLHIRSSWVTHTYFPQRKASHALFGSQRHLLVRRDDAWIIQSKTVVIRNDHIPTMLDLYCI
jgi:3-phenylpropionate/cinnamic acid dioxygenase small subunit